MKNKKSKLGLAGLLLLAGCATIKPTGSIDLAYVPLRTDDKPVENEVMVELDLGVKASIKKVDLLIGGTQRTYMYPFVNNSMWFKPNRQEYDIYTKINIDNLEFYAFHMCSHPVDDVSRWIYDEENIEYRSLNHDSITKIGIKFGF